MSERRHPSAPALACLAIVLLAVAPYLAGYFLLARVQSGAFPGHWCRIYRWHWLTVIYEPAGKVESAATGNQIDIVWIPGEGK